jgi:hypothetical protein
MKLCFHIGMHTGCRLKETSLPLENIDFKRGTITFGTPKGGATRAWVQDKKVSDPFRVAIFLACIVSMC